MTFLEKLSKSKIIKVLFNRKKINKSNSDYLQLIYRMSCLIISKSISIDQKQCYCVWDCLKVVLFGFKFISFLSYIILC